MIISVKSSNSPQFPSSMLFVTQINNLRGNNWNRCCPLGGEICHRRIVLGSHVVGRRRRILRIARIPRPLLCLRNLVPCANSVVALLRRGIVLLSRLWLRHWCWLVGRLIPELVFIPIVIGVMLRGFGPTVVPSVRASLRTECLVVQAHSGPFLAQLLGVGVPVVSERRLRRALRVHPVPITPIHFVVGTLVRFLGQIL